jgi:hypothetical protein
MSEIGEYLPEGYEDRPVLFLERTRPNHLDLRVMIRDSGQSHGV